MNFSKEISQISDTAQAALNYESEKRLKEVWTAIQTIMRNEAKKYCKKEWDLSQFVEFKVNPNILMSLFRKHGFRVSERSGVWLVEARYLEN